MYKIVGKLAELAETSTMLHQHAAVLMMGGKPLAWGVNSMSGGKNVHAERAAIQSYLNRFRMTLLPIYSRQKPEYALRQEGKPEA